LFGANSVALMFNFAGRLGFAFLVAALCLSGRTAHGQAAPAPYWIPSWPFGFGGNLTAGQSLSAFGNTASFDSADARGFSYMRYNFPNNWFAVAGGGGLNMNGLGQGGAFDSINALHYESVQFGYNFKNAGGLPLTVYAGVDTLKYDTGIGGPLAPFGTTSSTLTGYSAHTGVEFQPLPNVSLSLGLGYTQQPGH
jgi:hypothetical protein